MANLGENVIASVTDQLMDEDEIIFGKTLDKSNLKRKMLNISEKLKLINLVEASPKKRKDIAALFGIPVNTLTSIYANRERILEQCKGDYRNLNMKKLRASTYPDVEEALLNWYIKNYASAPNGHISCLTLRMKALQLAKSFGHENFSASNGWIERFKVRHNLRFKKYKKKNSSSTACTSNDSSLDISVDNSVNLSESKSTESSEKITSTLPSNSDVKNYDANLVKSEFQDSNGVDDNSFSSTQLHSHAPEVQLTEIDTDDQKIAKHYADNELNQSIQNVDEAFHVILHFIGTCTESISEKTLEAVKELKHFIETEKEKRKQTKITDYFKHVE